MEPVVTSFAIASTVFFVHSVLSVGFSEPVPGPALPDYSRNFPLLSRFLDSADDAVDEAKRRWQETDEDRRNYWDVRQPAAAEAIAPANAATADYDDDQGDLDDAVGEAARDSRPSGAKNVPRSKSNDETKSRLGAAYFAHKSFGQRNNKHHSSSPKLMVTGSSSRAAQIDGVDDDAADNEYQQVDDAGENHLQNHLQHERKGNELAKKFFMNARKNVPEKVAVTTPSKAADGQTAALPDRQDGESDEDRDLSAASATKPSYPPEAANGGQFAEDSELVSSIHIDYHPEAQSFRSRTEFGKQEIDEGQRRLKELYQMHYKFIRTEMMWSSHKKLCGPPIRKVILPDDDAFFPRPGQEYMPPFTMLYRCDDKVSGCCENKKKICGPIESTDVNRVFKVTQRSGSKTKTIYVQRQFQNHTACGCTDAKPIANITNYTPRDQEVPAAAVAEAVPIQEFGIATNSMDPQCECPYGFVAKQRVTESMTKVTCSCECYHGDQLCVRRLKGHKHVAPSDHHCILSGKCHPPNCIFGTYNKQRKRCPTSKEQRAAARKDSRNLISS